MLLTGSWCWWEPVCKVLVCLSYEWVEQLLIKSVTFVYKEKHFVCCLVVFLALLPEACYPWLSPPWPSNWLPFLWPEFFWRWLLWKPQWCSLSENVAFFKASAASRHSLANVPKFTPNRWGAISLKWVREQLLQFWIKLSHQGLSTRSRMVEFPHYWCSAYSL